MRQFQHLQYVAAAIACLGLVMPPAASAAEVRRAAAPASTTAKSCVSDVVLGEGGTLAGQVLNAQGAPLAQVGVVVRRSGRDVASAVTDAQGSFSIRGLQGGMYEVRSAGGSGIFRCWTAAASPPSANKQVLIVAGQDISRGQNSCPPGYRQADPKIVVGAIVVGLLAAGVAAWAITEHDSSS